MIRIIIIAAAILLAITGVAVAWTGSRDASPGTAIELPDVRQEDTEAGFGPDDDDAGDPDDSLDPDNSVDSVDGVESANSVDDSMAGDAASLSASVDSYSSDRSTFKAAPTPTSVIKPSPTTTVTKKSPTTAQQQYLDDSVSQYSYDSVSEYSYTSVSMESADSYSR